MLFVEIINIQEGLNMLSAGGTLFVVALGLAIIFTLGILNFAHGSMIMVGAYGAVVATEHVVSPWLGILIGLAVGLALGIVLELLFIRWLYARPMDTMVATIGIALVLIASVTIVFGRANKFVEPPLSGSVDLGFASYSKYRLFLVLVAFLLFLLLWVATRYTRAGLIVRAVIAHEGLSAALGINGTLVRRLTFVVGAALAGLAGALVAPIGSVEPNMGANYLIGAFMVVIVASSSVIGLAAASLLLGAAASWISFVASPVWGSLTIIVLATTILRVFPSGLAQFSFQTLFRRLHRFSREGDLRTRASSAARSSLQRVSRSPALFSGLRVPRPGRMPLGTLGRPTLWRGRRLSVRFALIMCATAVLAFAPFFVGVRTQDLLIQAFIFGIFAISLNLIWGYAGMLSLGHSAFFGIGAYLIAISATQIESVALAVIVGIVGGVSIALVFAFVVGRISFYGRVTPIYLAVITLALALILQQLASLGSFMAISKHTGGANGLGFSVVSWSLQQWYWVMAGALLVSTLVVGVVARSDFGRVLVGIRDNERRLRYLGFNVPRIKLLVFCASAALAALAGIALASYIQIVSPALLGLQIATQVVILVSIGGRGTILGPVCGALVIGIVGPEISANYPEVWQLILGLVFVLVVIFLPRGLYPALESFATYLWRQLVRVVGAAPTTVAQTSSLASDTGQSRIQAAAADTTVGRVNDVEKFYGSLEVLQGITLDMKAAEILCIVGPNGAGKSTLIRTITDPREISNGTVTLSGASTRRRSPAQIVALGVARTFQGTDLMETYTVADSLVVAGRRGSVPSLWRRTVDVRAPEEVIELARTTGLDQVLDVPVGELSHGLRQALELAMALSLTPTLLLLDEPTAGLTQEERQEIGQLLRNLAGQRRLGIVLIEHDLEFVRGITDRVAVLHQGRMEIVGPVDEVVGSTLVREIYLGAST